MFPRLSCRAQSGGTAWLKATMKRFLNLNEISLPILMALFITGLGIPAGLYLSARLLEHFRLHWPLLDLLARVFIGIGAFLLLLFFLLVVVEQIQDHLLYRRYLRERGKQIQDECPYCGIRQIHPFDYVCPVYGGEIHPGEKELDRTRRAKT
jgi:hypothetical protein